MIIKFTLAKDSLTVSSSGECSVQSPTSLRQRRSRISAILRAFAGSCYTLELHDSLIGVLRTRGFVITNLLQHLEVVVL